MARHHRRHFTQGEYPPAHGGTVRADAQEVMRSRDSARRFLSKESAHWAAEVLAGYGFRVYGQPLLAHAAYDVRRQDARHAIRHGRHGEPQPRNITASRCSPPAAATRTRTVTAKIEAEIEKAHRRPTSRSVDYDRRWPIEPSANIIRPTSILTASWPR